MKIYNNDRGKDLWKPKQYVKLKSAGRIPLLQPDQTL